MTGMRTGRVQQTESFQYSSGVACGRQPVDAIWSRISAVSLHCPNRFALPYLEQLSTCLKATNV